MKVIKILRMKCLQIPPKNTIHNIKFHAIISGYTVYVPMNFSYDFVLCENTYRGKDFGDILVRGGGCVLGLKGTRL